VGLGGMRLIREVGPLAGFALMLALGYARVLLRRASRPKLPKGPLPDQAPPGPQPPTRRQRRQARTFLDELPVQEPSVRAEDEEAAEAASALPKSPLSS